MKQVFLFFVRVVWNGTTLLTIKLLINNYPKTILTNDKLGLGNYNGINVVNIIDWLLEI